MKCNSKILAILLALAMALFLAGCSDDDGGDVTDPGDPQPDMIAGQFRAVGVYSDCWSHYTSMVFSGFGDASYDRIIDSDGDTDEGESFSYELHDDGQFGFDGNDDDIRVVRGMCDRSGDILAFNLPAATEPACLDISVRLGSGMGNGNFSGLYRGVSLEIDQDGTHESEVFTLNANGNGGVTYNAEMTSEGDNDTATFGYTIAANGAFSTVDDPSLKGMLSPDGSVLAFAELDDDDTALYLLFKAGSGMSNSSLQGEYIYLQMETDGDSCYGVVTIDGQGGYVATDLYSSGDLDGATSRHLSGGVQRSHDHRRRDVRHGQCRWRDGGPGEPRGNAGPCAADQEALIDDGTIVRNLGPRSVLIGGSFSEITVVPRAFSRQILMIR